MNFDEKNPERYDLLFDVRRSVRYHDRRRAFFEQLHRISATLTVLLAGSVLFDVARPGETAYWMTVLAVIAALLAAMDIVIGYAGRATLHHELKRRFVALEIAIVSGKDDPETTKQHQAERLHIEKDEPPIFRALDLLCHNEVAKATGFTREGDGQKNFANVRWWPQLTRHFFHWPDLAFQSNPSPGLLSHFSSFLLRFMKAKG
jgi:hypothetical protein